MADLIDENKRLKVQLEQCQRQREFDYHRKGTVSNGLQPLGTAEIYKRHKKVPPFEQEFRFRLIGDNGETIAQSEGYTQKHNATEVLKKYFPSFAVRDVTTG